MSIVRIDRNLLGVDECCGDFGKRWFLCGRIFFVIVNIV